MNLQRVFGALAVVAVILYGAGPSSAENQIYKLTWSPQSKVVLKGNSSLHPFTVPASSLNLTGTIELKEQFNSLNSLLTGRIQELQVVIPVAGLKSGKKELDKNLYQDLKGKTHPEITFRLSDFQLPAVVPVGNALPITLKGSLSVAGVEKAITIESRVSQNADGMHVTGKAPLLMTDFGIKPRKFMMVMKVDNQVIVEFDFVINAQSQILN
jgi:polyisoprenoid-binding protein YceI